MLFTCYTVCSSKVKIYSQLYNFVEVKFKKCYHQKKCYHFEELPTTIFSLHHMCMHTYSLLVTTSQSASCQRQDLVLCVFHVSGVMHCVFFSDLLSFGMFCVYPYCIMYYHTIFYCKVILYSVDVPPLHTHSLVARCSGCFQCG